MSFQKYLTEELESPYMRMGRSNVWYDPDKGDFECYFKVNGITYSVLGESEGGTYDDEKWKLQLRKKWSGNTEMVEDTKEVESAFIEAITEWVEMKNPTTFWWIASEKFPAYNNIAEALSKKFKNYNFINEAAITEETETKEKDELEYDYDNVKEEKKYKRLIFTRHEIKEDVTAEEMSNKELDSNEETFDTFKEPEDIVTNKDHLTYEKNDKLDKEGGY